MKLIQSLKTSFAKGIAFSLGIFATGLFAITVTGVINIFNPGDPVSSSKINENFQSLKAAIEGAHEVPVGTIVAWHKSLGGGATPALPVGWVECDGSTISDAASPYDGIAVPDLNSPRNSWNSAGSFLRGNTTSGDWEDDRFQGHRHGLYKNQKVFEWYANHPSGSNTTVAGNNDSQLFGGTNTQYIVLDPTTGSYGSVRTGNETRPVSMSVVWIIKIK